MRKQLITLLLASSMLLSGCVNIYPNDVKSETEEMTSQETVEQQIPLRESEGLKFWSIGNNTCYVMDIGTCKDNILVIPATSPKGETVVGVKDRAFYACSQINYVYLPDTVKSIGEAAFFKCRSLSSVELNNVETIGDFAFSECNFSLISIPQSVKSIGRAAFCLNDRLSSVRVHPDNLYYRGMRYGLIEIQTGTLILGCADDGYVFLNSNEGIKAIGDFAFYNNEALRWFDTNGVIEKVGVYAFSGCKNVTEIGIDDGLKEIGAGAFSGCSSLQYMKLYDSVTYIGAESMGGLASSNGLGILQGCTSLKEVYIGTGITEIPAYTFAGCTNLTTIEPHSEQGYLKNVKSIGFNAFKNCQSLTEIPLPSGLETIQNGAFVNCFNLKRLEIPEEVTFPTGTYGLFRNCYNLESVNLPANTERIDNSCFMSCSSLKSFVIPSGVTEIEETAFLGCYSLETLTVEEGNQTLIAKDGCVIERSTKTLVAITANAEIPTDGSVEVIADGVLTGIQKTDITIPEGVKVIGARTFRDNGRLKSVSIPRSVEKIQDYVFVNCWSLETIYYNGTVAEWKQLMQNYSWMTWRELTIQCTDGEIYVVCSTPAKG